MCNLVRGHYGEHFCEISLNLGQLLSRRYTNTYISIFFTQYNMSSEDISIFSSDSHFVQRSRTVCLILVKETMKTILRRTKTI